MVRIICEHFNTLSDALNSWDLFQGTRGVAHPDWVIVQRPNINAEWRVCPDSWMVYAQH